MNKIRYTLGILLLLAVVPGSLFAQNSGIQRVKGGFGKRDFSATTTAVLYTIKEHLQPSVIVNGDFATNTTWVTTGSDWVIGGGAATNVASAAGTSVMYNDVTAMKDRIRYQVIYTTASMSAGDSLAVSLGTQTMPSVTANGTYTNLFDVRSDTEMEFTATVTDAGSFTLDTITVRPVQDDAYLYRATFLNSSTGTVNIAFNTSLANFAEFSDLTAISLKADETYDFVGDNEQMYWLKSFVYETSTATSVLEVQGQ